MMLGMKNKAGIVREVGENFRDLRGRRTRQKGLHDDVESIEVLFSSITEFLSYQASE
jgi:hypothetical protein